MARAASLLLAAAAAAAAAGGVHARHPGTLLASGSVEVPFAGGADAADAQGFWSARGGVVEAALASPLAAGLVPATPERLAALGAYGVASDSSSRARRRLQNTGCTTNNLWGWNLNGTAGASGAITAGVGAFGATNTCPDAYGDPVAVGLAKSGRVVPINLTVVPPPGSVLYVDTCGTTPTTGGAGNTTLFVGRGCPSSWSPFGCIAANDDAGVATPSCADRSQVWAPLGTDAAGLQSLYYAYVVVPAATSATVSLRLTWQLLIPGPVSASPTPSATPWPSDTPMPTMSPWCGSALWNASGTLTGAAGNVTAATNNPRFIVPQSLSGVCNAQYTGLTFPNDDQSDPAVGKSNFWAIDLGFTPPQDPAPPATVTIDTCAFADFDTALYVGSGCGFNADAFSCLASNDDADNLPPGVNCVSLASRVVVPVRTRVLYAMVVGRAGSSNGNYTLSWAYAAASATPSASATIPLTPSGTPPSTPTASLSVSPPASPSTTRGVSASVSPPGTPSNSGTAGATRSATQTPTVSRSGSKSITASSSGSRTNTPSVSSSASVTASNTPTRTPSASNTPNCAVAFDGVLSGVSGNFSGSTEFSTNALFAAPGMAGYADPWSCLDVVSPDSSRGMPAESNKHVLLVDLGAAPVLGGTFTVDSCSLDTLFDTLLFVGLGCPANSTRFRCAFSNDDACGDGQSSVTFGPVWQRQLYVAIAGYGSAAGPYTLRWRYDPPDPTDSPSSSATPSFSPVGTPTRTRYTSPTGTPPATGTATSSLTGTRTPTTTASNTDTPRGTPSSTSTAGICGMGASNAYISARLTGTSGAWTGSLDGQDPLFRYGNCRVSDGNGNYGLIKYSPQAFVALDIGPTAPSSGFIVFDTCNDTTFDTVLYAGTGCPSLPSFSSFGCYAMNDDTPGCGTFDPDRGTNVNSRVAIPITPGVRNYYAMVSGFRAGVTGTFRLGWSWVPGFTAAPTPDPNPDVTPSSTQAATATPPGTPSATTSATGKATASASATAAVPAFRWDSVLALRLSSVGIPGATDGTALPIFVDELGPAGGLRRTVAVPAVEDANNYACTLAAAAGPSPAWLYEQEGLPQLADDAGRVTFPCYARPPGGQLSPQDDKVVASIEFGGWVDTTSGFFAYNGVPNASAPQALRTAAAAAGGGTFYVGGTGGSFLYHGVRRVQRAVYNAIHVSGLVPGTPGHSDVRYLGVHNGVLHGVSGLPDGRNVSGLHAYAAGLPASLISRGGAASLPGWGGESAPFEPFAYVLDGDAPDTSNNAWVAVDHARASYNVMRYARNAFTGVWAAVPADAVSFSTTLPVYSVTGRWDNTTGSFVLYAATRTAVWRYDTATRAAPVAIATAGAGETFRGVALAPGWPQPASGTPTATRSNGATPSGTGTASWTASGTPSSSPSPASRTATASATSSATSTASASGAPPSASSTGTLGASSTSTGSATDTPSTTGTASPTGTATTSATPSGTPSGTASQTPTGSGTTSPGSVPSASPTATTSAGGTPAGTASATATGSASSSAGGTPTASGSAPATASATGTATATPSPASATASNTETPSGTPAATLTPTGSVSAGATPSWTPSTSLSSSATQSAAATPSNSPSSAATPSQTVAPSASQTVAATPSTTATLTPSARPTSSATASVTPTGTRSPSYTVTTSGTQTLSPGASPSATATYIQPRPLSITSAVHLRRAFPQTLGRADVAAQLRADWACFTNASYTPADGSHGTPVYIDALQDLNTGAWTNFTSGGGTVNDADVNAMPLAARGACDPAARRLLLEAEAPADSGGRRLDETSVAGTLVVLRIALGPPPLSALDVTAGLTWGYERPAEYWYSRQFATQAAKAAAITAVLNAEVSTPTNGWATSGNPRLSAGMLRTRSLVANYVFDSVDPITLSLNAPPAQTEGEPQRLVPLVSFRAAPVPPPPPGPDTTAGIVAGAVIGGAAALALVAFGAWLLVARRRSKVAKRRSVVTMSLEDYLKYAIVAKGPGAQLEHAAAALAPSSALSKKITETQVTDSVSWGTGGDAELRGHRTLVSANPLAAHQNMAALPASAQSKLASFDREFTMSGAGGASPFGGGGTGVLPPPPPPVSMWGGPNPLLAAQQARGVTYGHLPPPPPPPPGGHRLAFADPRYVPARPSATAANVALGYGLAIDGSASPMAGAGSGGSLDYVSPMHGGASPMPPPPVTTPSTRRFIPGPPPNALGITSVSVLPGSGPYGGGGGGSTPGGGVSPSPVPMGHATAAGAYGGGAIGGTNPLLSGGGGVGTVGGGGRGMGGIPALASPLLSSSGLGIPASASSGGAVPVSLSATAGSPRSVASSVSMMSPAGGGSGGGKSRAASGVYTNPLGRDSDSGDRRDMVGHAPQPIASKPRIRSTISATGAVTPRTPSASDAGLPPAPNGRSTTPTPPPKRRKDAPAAAADDEDEDGAFTGRGFASASRGGGAGRR